jgi:type VI secretion system secreted protein VgrG
VTSGGGHVHAVDVTAQSVVDSVGLRDYWAEQPDFEAIGSAEAAPAKTLAYYDRTRVGTGSTEAILKRRSRDVLAALRVGQELIRLEANVPVLPGVALTVDGAPMQEAAAPLLVLTTRLRWSSQPGEAAITRCTMPARQRLVPARLPKPKVGGLHTAKVVGEGEVDVDPLGRVLCELNWDHRPWTRRVRVSQAWAGPGYGFVTLSPLTLPAQNTVSTWRSKSSPGGDGYNEILMDDPAGSRWANTRTARGR